MTDVNQNKGQDILVDPSINETPKSEDQPKSPDSNAEKEGLLKEIRIERDKRHLLEDKIAELETKFNADSPNPSTDNDIDFDLVADRLTPTLLKRGFITKAEQENETRANQYAADLKNLSEKYNGKDGRPVFDPSEVANHAKEKGIFNLEAAYRDLHWNEILDFEKKKGNSEDIETEKPNPTNQSKPGERVLLTREYLNKRLAEPDGKVWFDKNHDKIMAAMAKGQL